MDVRTSAEIEDFMPVVADFESVRLKSYSSTVQGMRIAQTRV